MSQRPRLPRDTAGWEYVSAVYDGRRCITLRRRSEAFVIVEQVRGWRVTHVVANGPDRARTTEWVQYRLPYEERRARG